ncbi:DEAD/DEAH box helicase [bacterium endosymbiont of Pedicinus badii]|uniref:DEAD/DEAH box helicase n=1 Tax=bacterium endosymbiont of Pedicinus badii TaxID=1719126 RepID=UPI0009BBCF72|nr:DEAD/DEAH box helicase [bacterium endosymbiont of Pedicinus badii]OQM34372.1 hypothetical protein AOQ89_00570 [bacterium endosymbiont of Pedicinus badii]
MQKNRFKNKDILVHLKYGLGKYLGTETIINRKIESEYIVLQYADQDKLYVPISSLDLVKKYKNFDNKKIVLDSLRSFSWKRKIEKNIELTKKIAKELFEIYANRFRKKSFSFNCSINSYIEFYENSPYKLTKEQKKAILEIKKDMHRNYPMNRLLCGDSGVGKTEVAMHAAFIASKNKKQTLFLVPSTILAKQHFHNFKKRLLKYSISTAIYSKFENGKEKKKIFDSIKYGLVDIVISTHKILYSKVFWFDLGLLIIDEEHKFGVLEKEKIQKSIGKNIDTLLISATPIPRTTSMVISKFMSISKISTFPKDRIPTKIFILKYKKNTIKKAILREISRGGQIFYIQNRIKKIQKTIHEIKNIIPSIQIAFIHGDMEKKILQKIVKNFYKKKFDLLVCTTIIEIGLDIPNVNTIFIEKGENFGLSQLYQLKGRVGRSKRSSFIYIITSKNISNTSKNRIRTFLRISKKNKQIGLHLSYQDLKNRGSGEILGKKQSGIIHSIGINMHLYFLKKAIENLKNKKKVSYAFEQYDKTTEVEILVPTNFPKKYIKNPNLRIEFYKKIADLSSKKEIEKLKIELEKKFGSVPKETIFLLKIAEIKILCRKIGIKKLFFDGELVILKFYKKNKIKTRKLIYLSKYEKFSISNKERMIQFRKKILDYELRIKEIKKIIESIV